MARITVEDCIDKLPSRFELVLVASNRARKLHSGESPTVEKDNDKNTVIALREISDETIPVEEMKNNLVEEYQTVSLIEEEEELNLNKYDEKENDNFISDEEKTISDEENTILDEENTILDEEIQNLVDNEESQVHHSNEIDIENNNSNSESEILK